MNGVPTAGMAHSDVVGMVKNSTTSVKMRIQLASTAAAAAATGAAPDNTLWTSVRSEAERQMELNRERDSLLVKVAICGKLHHLHPAQKQKLFEK